MFEDKSIFKFVCASLALISIIIPGPFVPIVSLLLAISLFIYKIKKAKESAEGFESLMLDIVMIVIVIMVDIGFLGFRIWAQHQYSLKKNEDYSYFSSWKEDEKTLTTSEIAELAIFTYKSNYPNQFSANGNHYGAIKKGFEKYLKEELEISDVKVNKNIITCSIGLDTVKFTIQASDITYQVEKYR